jgi:hypothetical protein
MGINFDIPTNYSVTQFYSEDVKTLEYKYSKVK